MRCGRGVFFYHGLFLFNSLIYLTFLVEFYSEITMLLVLLSPLHCVAAVAGESGSLFLSLAAFYVDLWTTALRVSDAWWRVHRHLSL